MYVLALYLATARFFASVFMSPLYTFFLYNATKKSFPVLKKNFSCNEPSIYKAFRPSVYHSTKKIFKKGLTHAMSP